MNGNDDMLKPPPPPDNGFFARFKPAPVVSVLRLSGVIGRAGPVRGSLNMESLDRLIARAFQPRRLRAVALGVNSPGGSPVQSALIARRIRELADERKVPVYAFAEDIAASGGYWLACAADEIFAEDTSIVGSIGVVSAGFGFADLIRRHGIERRVHTAGARKAMLDPFRAEDPEDVARLKSIQKDIHDAFKDLVRRRRAGRLKGPEDDLFSGDVWSGREALDLGLIDGLGDMRTVLRERYGKRVRLRPVVQRRGLLRRRLGVGATTSLSPDAVVDLLAALDDWALWKRYGL